jgi:hypothetical protein
MPVLIPGVPVFPFIHRHHVTTETTKRRRARTVASDEAHAWARSVPLDNPYGKTVLRALTLYVNGEGACFVGIDQLAADTDLSVDTVRRRLVWLEQVGAIVRLQQWLDQNGRRNSEGKGKRTTDEIRLLLDADLDDIERRAKGENSIASRDDATEFSPSCQQGLNESAEITAENVSPRPALGQPSHLCDHLISEPEPESSPQPPSGGSVDIEGWKEFQEDWVEPILRQAMAQQVWTALKPEERLLARSAARGYVAWRKSQRKPPNVIGAHLFLRERDAWAEFARRDPGRPGSDGAYPRTSVEARALIGLHDVCDAADGFRKIYVRDAVTYRKPMTPQILAFAQVPPRGEWVMLTYPQAGAWENLLREVAVISMRKHFREGDLAPWPWPPSAEGKIYPAEAPPQLTADELADFK